MNQISFQSVYQTITGRGEFKLGQRAMTPDGREWVFVHANEGLKNCDVVVPNTVVSADLWSSSADNQSRIVYLAPAANTLTTGAYEDAIGLVDCKTKSKQATERTEYTQFENKEPDISYWNELFRVSKKQIIWGVNFYTKINLHGGRLVWDKKGTAFGNIGRASCRERV